MIARFFCYVLASDWDYCMVVEVICYPLNETLMVYSLNSDCWRRIWDFEGGILLKDGKIWSSEASMGMDCSRVFKPAMCIEERFTKYTTNGGNFFFLFFWHYFIYMRPTLIWVFCIVSVNPFLYKWIFF